MPLVSAGLLLYRRTGGRLEVLLGHPGGPFWAKRDAGAWTLPKGMVEPGEDLLAAARREFTEETGLPSVEPFLPLGSIRQKGGKTIHAWAFPGDCDPAQCHSNLMRTQWPPKSGKWQSFPELDRYGFFTLDEARQKVNPAQSELLDRLAAALEGAGS